MQLIQIGEANWAGPKAQQISKADLKEEPKALNSLAEPSY